MGVWNDLQFSRRDALATALGVAPLGLASETSAFASGADDWRSQLVVDASGRAEKFIVRPLVNSDGRLECLLLESGGYVVVDAGVHEFVEYSPRGSEVVAAASGCAAYFGPGLWFAREGSSFRHIIDDSPIPAAGADEAAELFLRNRTDRALERASGRPAGSAVPRGGGYGNGWLIRGYEAIRDCNVLPNGQDEGICGWIAASILLRFWHVRFPKKRIIGAEHLVGNNLRSTSPKTNNLAYALKGTRWNSSWALTVRDGLLDYARKRRFKATGTFYAFSPGVHESIRDHRPVILFGTLPKQYKKGKGWHAVLAYGYTSKGHNIVHYGWPRYQRVVLSSGVVTSNTQFKVL